MSLNNNHEGIKQRPREKLKYVDEDLLVDKTGRKAFRSAAYAIGIAVGFLILSPLLPEIGTPEENTMIVSVFRTLSMWMIFYGFAISFAFFFMRPRVRFIMAILNWVVIPTVLIWVAFQISDIMGGA